MSLFGQDSSQDSRSDPIVQSPSIPTFVVKWGTADNGYYVKKSVFIGVPSVSPNSHPSIFEVSGLSY